MARILIASRVAIGVGALLLGLCSGCGQEPPPTASSKPEPVASEAASKDGTGGRVMLLAAASTSDAVKEVAALFEAKSGTKVEISTGASNALAQQILAGAPADVFLSANQKWADELRSKGAAAEIRPLLGNRLVLVVPKGNPAGVKEPGDLLGEAVKRIALAGEKVPAGQYADQSLRALGLDAKLTEAGKIVRGQDVRITLGYVERGEVEAAIVYATDAAVAKEIETVYTFDPSTHDPLVYPAVLVKREGDDSQGRALFEFLFSNEATAVFRKHGFLSATEAPAKPAGAP